MEPKRLIVDSHLHIFPDRLSGLLDRFSENLPKVSSLRPKGRHLLKPLTGTLHKAQPFTRHLPSFVRHALDELGGLATLPSLLVESTPADLQKQMAKHHVNFALAIAHPPYSSNEFISELVEENDNLVFVANIGPRSESPVAELETWLENGARAIKIHPAADGQGPDNDAYRKTIEVAANYDVPVIVHTGAISIHLFYKDPSKGHAELFESWFKEFPSVRFVLAHMNFHFPTVAMDLMERYLNVFTDTSWQPTETIAEAVRRLGSDRILFGSDWPLGGNNLAVSLKRIYDGQESGILSSKDAEKILGLNSARLFGIEDVDNRAEISSRS